MKFIILFLVACSSDVSVIKRITDEDSSKNIEESATQEPSGEINIEGTGGYVHYYLRQLACPGCVGESQELLVEFTAKFHEPVNDSHTSWLPTLGECTNQLLITSPSTNPVDVGNSISVQGSPHSFTAMKTGDEYYAYLYETEYDRNAIHTISLSGENEQISFRSIEGYDYIEPYAMLYVDPSYAFAAPIYKTGMTFSWAPYETSRIYMILMAVYSYDGSQLLGYAACTGPDQGFMTFPSTALQSFPSQSLVLIHLSRHSIGMVPYEPMGSYIETHMEWEVVGTGYLQ